MIRFLMFQTDVVSYDCYHKLTLFGVNSINKIQSCFKRNRKNGVARVDRISFTLFENKNDDDHVNLYLYAHSLYIDLSRLVVWDRPRQLRPSHTNLLYYYYYFVFFLFVCFFCRFSLLFLLLICSTPVFIFKNLCFIKQSAKCVNINKTRHASWRF